MGPAPSRASCLLGTPSPASFQPGEVFTTILQEGPEALKPSFVVLRVLVHAPSRPPTSSHQSYPRLAHALGGGQFFSSSILEQAQPL